MLLVTFLIFKDCFSEQELQTSFYIEKAQKVWKCALKKKLFFIRLFSNCFLKKIHFQNCCLRKYILKIDLSKNIFSKLLHKKDIFILLSQKRHFWNCFLKKKIFKIYFQNCSSKIAFLKKIHFLTWSLKNTFSKLLS